LDNFSTENADLRMRFGFWFWIQDLLVFQDLVFRWTFGFFIGVFLGFVVSKLLLELVTAAGLFVTWVLILFFYPFQRAAPYLVTSRKWDVTGS
jgi:hypothetical protein